MPWIASDVKRHKKGLTDSQRNKWVKIANAVLRDCEGDGGLGGFKDCESKAIIIANSKVGPKRTKESTISPLTRFLAESFTTRPIRALLVYLHKKIIPMYKNFEEGHQTEHVLGVIKWSSRIVNKLGNKFPIDINLMYTVAAFHDTGLKFGMAGHDKNVVKIIDQYKKDLLIWFSEKEIVDITDACLYHDLKDGKKPKNIYGIILHDAAIIQNEQDENLLMLPDSKQIMKEKLRFKK